MFEAYAVGVSLKLVDLVTAPGLKIVELFERIDVLSLRVQTTLRAMGAEAGGIKSIAAAANASTAAMERFGFATAEVERRIAALKAVGNIPSAPVLVPGALPGGGGRGGHGGGHGGLHGGRVHAGPGGLGVSSLSWGLGGEAMVPIAATAAAGWLAYSGYRSAANLQLEKARFDALGLGPKMNAEAMTYVNALKTYGTSRAQNMALFRDAQMIFRDSASLEHAEMVTPLMAKMRFANETLFGGEHAGNIESKFMDMLKVIELRKGLTSRPEFERQANMIQQVLTTTGGRVDATQYLNMMKTGGVAAKSLSNEALYYQLEPIIQEMGGARVGTGLQSAYQNLVIGRLLGKKPVAELQRLGLLDPSKVMVGNSGQIKEFQPGALKGTDLLQKSPVDFLEKVLLPAFAAKGITKESDVLRELATIFTNRTASNLFGTIYQQLPVIRKGEKMSAQALSIEGGAKLAKDTGSGYEKEFVAAWTDFKTDFGKDVLPQVTKLLHGGSELLRSADVFMNTKGGWFDKIKGFGNGYVTYAKWLWTGGATGMLARGLLGDDDKAAPGTSPNVKTGNSRPVQVSTQVHLDGRAIANVVSTHQSRSLMRPNSTSGFDPLMNPLPQAVN